MEGIPGEEEGKPSAPLLLQLQAQDPSREAQKPMPQNTPAQSTSSALHQTLIFSPRHLLKEHYFI